MKRCSSILAFCAVSATAYPSLAADPTSIFGRWIEKFPNGNGMVTEFSASSISSFPVDQNGKPVAAANKMTVSYKDLGGPNVAINFNGGGGIMVMQKSATEITLDFPGVGAHELTKIP